MVAKSIFLPDEPDVRLEGLTRVGQWAPTRLVRPLPLSSNRESAHGGCQWGSREFSRARGLSTDFILFWFVLEAHNQQGSGVSVVEVLTGIADEVVRQAGSKPQGRTV